MTKRFKFIFLVVACFSFVVQSVTARDGFTPFFTPGIKPALYRLLNNQNVQNASSGLLSPERFTMHESMVWQFSSVGGSGNLLGMYLNSMEYRIAEPLKVRLLLGYQMSNQQLFGKRYDRRGIDGRLMIPAADIIYKPFKNTSIIFSYRDYSSYGSYGGGYSRGYRGLYPYRMPYYSW